MKCKISNKFIYNVTILATVFFVGTACVNNCFANTNISNENKQKITAKLNNYMNKCAKDKKFNGSILVAKNGNIVLKQAYGFSDKQGKIKNTIDSKFLIGSITKQFTAVAIMQLQEKGLLNVNDTIGKYISGFSHGNSITIHQLLTHTSGLSTDLKDVKKIDSTPYSVDDAIAEIEDMDIKLLFQPGDSYNYSNLGYMILSYIIEKVSGSTYEGYITENIFKPLEMKNSGFGYDNVIQTKLSLGYDSDGKVLSSDANNEEARLLSGAGEIYSTVEDLYKWDRALYTEKIISKDSLNKMYTSYGNDYGYGWNILGKDVYEHGGTMSGFSSCIKRLVGDNSFIVVLSNDLNSTLVNNIDDDITKIIEK